MSTRFESGYIRFESGPPAIDVTGPGRKDAWLSFIHNPNILQASGRTFISLTTLECLYLEHGRLEEDPSSDRHGFKSGISRFESDL